MAPKRKAVGSPTSESAPKKRSTRVPVVYEDDSPPPPAPVKKTKSKSSMSASTSSKKKDKGKTKQKKEEVITISSDLSGEESDVVIEMPKKEGKAAPVKKNKSKVPAASTSTADKEKDKAAMKKQSSKVSKVSKASKARSLPFEDAFPAWFSQFAEEGEPDKMGGEGIEKLFEDMELSMEGAHPFILAYRVGAAPGTFGSFSRVDFKRTFQPFNIASSSTLSDWLAKAHDEIMGSVNEYNFRRFYAFVFPFLKNEGAKTIPGEMAVAMWGTVLAPKYPLAESFVEYAIAQGDKFKAVSLDVWTQMLEFCEAVQPDLTGWSEDDAWPSTIDAFVEWKKEKDAAAA